MSNNILPSRVELPQAMCCGGCGQKIAAPYRGKPCLLLGTELVLFCNAACKRTTVDGASEIGCRTRGESP